MPYRRFNGTAIDGLILPPPVGWVPTGPVTIALLIRPQSLANMSLLESSSGLGLRMATNGFAVVTAPSMSMVTRTAVFAAGAWRIVVLTKGSGTTTARLHVHDFASGLWARTDGALASIPVTTELRLGYSATSTLQFTGDIAALALWQAQLTDLQVNQLATIGAMSLWPTIAAGARALWTLEQPNVVVEAVDRVSAASQNAVRGTTAVVEAPPIVYEPGCVAYPVGRTWDDGPLSRWNGSAWARMRGLVTL